MQPRSAPAPVPERCKGRRYTAPTAEEETENEEGKQPSALSHIKVKLLRQVCIVPFCNMVCWGFLKLLKILLLSTSLHFPKCFAVDQTVLDEVNNYLCMIAWF